MEGVTLAGSWRVYSGSAPDPASPSAGHILLHPHRPRWLVLNGTGLEIARRIAQGASVDQIAAALVSRHGLAPEIAREDVALVRDRLGEEGFLGESAERPQERAPALDSVYLHLTTRCNFSCPHCYALPSARRSAAATELPTRLVLGLLDELAGLGGRAVTLSGGEALLHPGLRPIVERAARLGLQARLLTNGALLDGEWAAFLGAQGVAVQVSLDGSRPEVHDAVRGPGSFAGALRAIGLLQEAGLAAKLAVCATVMRGNARDLGEIVRLAERLGVPRVRFLPLRRAGMARERWEEIAAGLGPEDHERFYDEIAARGAAAKPAAEVSCGLSGFVLKPPPGSDAEEILCPVGRKIALEADGEAFPCELLTGASHRLGTIHRGSLAALMRSVGMRRSCAELCARRRVIERCASCLWSNLCQGGCMGQAADHAGTIWAVDDFCDYRRRAYAAAFDRILGLEAAAAP